MMRGNVQVNFRMPTELVDALKTCASNNGRSLTAEIQYALNAAVVEMKALKQMKIRIPDFLHMALKQRAKINGCSLNSEISRRLKTSFESETA